MSNKRIIDASPPKAMIMGMVQNRPKLQQRKRPALRRSKLIPCVCSHCGDRTMQRSRDMFDHAGRVRCSKCGGPINRFCET